MGDSRGGGGAGVQLVIFLGQKFTILLFFFKKSPKEHDQEMFLEIFQKKIAIFQGRKLCTRQDFWRSWGGFLAFLF